MSAEPSVPSAVLCALHTLPWRDPDARAYGGIDGGIDGGRDGGRDSGSDGGCDGGGGSDSDGGRLAGVHDRRGAGVQGCVSVAYSNTKGCDLIYATLQAIDPW